MRGFIEEMLPMLFRRDLGSHRFHILVSNTWPSCGQGLFPAIAVEVRRVCCSEPSNIWMISWFRGCVGLCVWPRNAKHSLRTARREFVGVGVHSGRFGKSTREKLKIRATHKKSLRDPILAKNKLVIHFGFEL
jgi:hypothetical protein